MTTASRFVSCCRVGTDKQGRSGLSLECSPAIAAYVASAHGLIA